MKNKFLFVCLLAGTLLTINGCKKTDTIGREPETAIIEKLFPVNKTTDADLKIIMQQAIKENNSKHFAAGFVERNGYINWAQGKKTISGGNTAIIAPFAFENGNRTNGLLVALLDRQQKVTFKFLYRQQLNTQTDSRLQSLLNYFDYKLFNNNKFSYASERQVPQQLKQKFPGANILNKIRPKYRIVENNAARTECFTYVEIIDYCYVPSGEYCECDEDSQYYEYSLTQAHQYCYTTYDEWMAPEDWNNGYGGGGSWDAQSQLAYELNAILLLGDSYAFQNVNPNNSLAFYTVDDFKNYITERDAGTTFETVPSGIVSNGNDTVVTTKVNRSLSGGERINIKLSKDPTNQLFSVMSVTSSDYGITLGWDYIQDSYSSSTTGNEITVHVWGYERYFAAIKSFGILFKKALHFKVKINKTTGSIISSEKV